MTNLRRFLFLLLLPFAIAEGYKYELSCCAIFRDEAPYLKEWIEFHKLVGVQHFYLYNNRSRDQYRQVLAPYILRGEVELIEWSWEYAIWRQWTAIQHIAYNLALKRAYKKTKWLAFLDIDEFLFAVEKDNLRDFLRDY